MQHSILWSTLDLGVDITSPGDQFRKPSFIECCINLIVVKISSAKASCCMSLDECGLSLFLSGVNGLVSGEMKVEKRGCYTPLPGGNDRSLVELHLYSHASRIGVTIIPTHKFLPCVSTFGGIFHRLPA